MISEAWGLESYYQGLAAEPSSERQWMPAAAQLDELFSVQLDVASMPKYDCDYYSESDDDFSSDDSAAGSPGSDSSTESLASFDQADLEDRAVSPIPQQESRTTICMSTISPMNLHKIEVPEVDEEVIQVPLLRRLRPASSRARRGSQPQGAAVQRRLSRALAGVSPKDVSPAITPPLSPSSASTDDDDDDDERACHFSSLWVPDPDASHFHRGELKKNIVSRFLISSTYKWSHTFCPSCHLNFRDVNEVYRHFSATHIEYSNKNGTTVNERYPFMTCMFCPYTQEPSKCRRSNLVSHVLRHFLKEFPCPHNCGAVYKQNPSLDKHLRQAHRIYTHRSSY